MAISQDKAMTADLARSLESATTLMQDLLGDIKENATSFALLKQKLEALEETVDVLSKIVRDGNNNSRPMITRLALVEKSVIDMGKYLDEIHEKVEKIEDGIKNSLMKEKQSEAEFKREQLIAKIKLFGIAAPGAISLSILLIKVLSGMEP